MLMRNLGLLSCLLVTSCADQALATDQAGKFRVVAKCSRATLTSTLVATKHATLVVAFGPHNQDPHNQDPDKRDPDKQDTLAATIAAKRATRPFVITIGEAPKTEPEIADAIIVAETGAAVAVDLALLACNGITIPKAQLEIGSRTITPANRAAGGDISIAPGDAVVALMRMQHTGLLTNNPETDVRHLIGVIQADPSDPWQQQTTSELLAATARYPQLEVVRQSAPIAGDNAHVAQCQLLVASGCRALLVTCSDPAKTKQILAAAAAAPDGAVPVIVLDPLLQVHDTCVIGCSPASLGKTAASIVQQLLPEGGDLITCLPVADNAPNSSPYPPITQQRVRGFCEALGLPSERLLNR